MVFYAERKSQILKIHYRNRQKVDGDWMYSGRDAFDRFSKIFLNIAFYDCFILCNNIQNLQAKAYVLFS